MNDSPPPVRRILESALYVTSLERSSEFYRRVFGFETMLRDDRMCALAVPDGQVLLLFRHGGSTHPSETPFGTIPPHDAQGQQHICFSITHATFSAWRDHLGALGVGIESQLIQPQGGSSLYFRDPDGHSLEVATSGLWPNDPVLPRPS